MKTMIRRLLQTLMGLVLCTPVLAANLLVNGDFTQTDPADPFFLVPPGWTNIGEMEGVISNDLRGTPAYQRPGEPDTVNFYDFGGFGRVGLARVGSGIAQTFATAPGRQYRLRFAMSSEFRCRAADSTQNDTTVSVGSLNVTVPVPYVPTAVCGIAAEPDEFKKPWVVKTFTFTATSASSTLQFITATVDSTMFTGNDPLITGVEVIEISPLLTVNKQLAGSGRLGANDQFTVQIKDSSNAVVNSTANSTTQGSGAAVSAGTGTSGPTRLVAGASYSIAEVMAPASASTLGFYAASVSCSNATSGGTPVSGITSLGQSIVLANNDVVSCTVTNTPAPPGGITGVVFADVGRGAGVANDGILNGTEQPLAGVRLQLSNCAGTVYGQAFTDGQGAYRFATPAVAVGAPLCVVQTNLNGQISTGASVEATALPSGTPVTVSATAYTYDRALDRIAFSWNGTGHANLNFGDVPPASWAPSGSKTAAPGSTVSYAHTFTAGTAGSVVFSISASAATPSLNGWSERIFADPTCSGALQPGAAQLYPPTGAGIAVTAQQKVCVVVQQFVPAQAQIGHKNTLTVQAAFSHSNASPALGTNHTVSDTTLVDNASLNLLKEVRNVTQGGTFGANNQARSGDVLEYRITYTNTTPSVLSNLSVNDTTPAFTSFVSSSAGSTPAGLTACVKSTPANPAPAAPVPCTSSQAAGGSGAVIWRFTGSLPGSASGQVSFQVKVD